MADNTNITSTGEELRQSAQAVSGVLAAPEAGQEFTYSVVPGDVVTVDFPVDAVEILISGQDVVLRFENGGSITLEGFAQLAAGDNPPAIQLTDGTVLSGDVVVSSLAVGEIEAAAGPGAGGAGQPGGGGSRYSDDFGDLSDGLNTIPGTEDLNDPSFGFATEPVDGLVPDAAPDAVAATVTGPEDPDPEDPGPEEPPNGTVTLSLAAEALTLLEDNDTAGTGSSGVYHDRQEPQSVAAPASGRALDIQVATADSSPDFDITVTISGLPADAWLTNGAGGNFPGGADIVLTEGQLAGLTLHLAPESSLDFSLDVTATNTNTATGQIWTANVALPVTVHPVADIPEMEVGAHDVGETLYADGDEGAFLQGYAGDDQLYGGAGDDTLRGGAGDDTAWGAGGDDEIHGGTGDDDLRGEAGDDRLEGDAGDDFVSGGAGGDEIYGDTAGNAVSFDLDLTARLGDIRNLVAVESRDNFDGSERLSLEFQGVPEGSTLTSATHAVTHDSDSGTWTIDLGVNVDSLQDLGLVLTVPVGLEDFDSITVTARTVDTDEDAADATQDVETYQTVLSIPYAEAVSAAGDDYLVGDRLAEDLSTDEDDGTDLGGLEPGTWVEVTDFGGLWPSQGGNRDFDVDNDGDDDVRIKALGRVDTDGDGKGDYMLMGIVNLDSQAHDVTILDYNDGGLGDAGELRVSYQMADLPAGAQVLLLTSYPEAGDKSYGVDIDGTLYLNTSEVVPGQRNNTLSGDTELDIIGGGDDFGGPQAVFGDPDTEADDLIYGGGGADRIWGNGGDDTLDGGDQGDVLDGGAGDDILSGGAGDDILVDDGWIMGGMDVRTSLYDVDTLWNLTLDGNQAVVTPYSDYEGGVVGQFDFGTTGSLTQGIGVLGDGSGISGPDEAVEVFFGGLVLNSVNVGVRTLATGEAGTWTAYLDGQEVGDGAIGAVEGGLDGRATAGIEVAGGFDTLVFRAADGSSDFHLEYIQGGNDQLHGGAGDDVLAGGLGSDLLTGGSDHDLLLGGAGDDTVRGDSGDDLVAGGSGNDQLEGGLGADIFLFDVGHNSGHDTILDFSFDQGDKIGLLGDDGASLDYDNGLFTIYDSVGAERGTFVLDGYAVDFDFSTFLNSDSNSDPGYEQQVLDAEALLQDAGEVDLGDRLGDMRNHVGPDATPVDGVAGGAGTDSGADDVSYVIYSTQ